MRFQSFLEAAAGFFLGIADRRASIDVWRVGGIACSRWLNDNWITLCVHVSQSTLQSPGEETKSGDTIACPAGSGSENTRLLEARQAMMSPFFVGYSGRLRDRNRGLCSQRGVAWRRYQPQLLPHRRVDLLAHFRVLLQKHASVLSALPEPLAFEAEPRP